MNRENRFKKLLYGMLLMLVTACLAGCGGKGDKNTGKQPSQSETDVTQQLYMITENDMMEECIVLRSLETGLENYYDYGIPTQFRDKYGTYTSAAQFTPGRIVTIGEQDTDGYLLEVQLSDQVWEQEKVKRFSIDEEKGILTIGSTKYSIRDKVLVFSNGAQIPLSMISEDDVLTIVGMEKKILSIIVTTGHGTLALTNTDLFVDSFLQLNQNIFAMITGDMDMELKEGTYTLKVANDGWGGTTKIQVKRGERTEIDLNTLKGEGKKKGLIHFQIDVEDVEVYVDYVLIDHTKPVELTYGTHVLKIEADGYDAWKKYLSVNSEDATLVIELDESGDNKDTEDEEDTEDTEESEETESEDTEETENTEDKSTETEVSEVEESEATEGTRVTEDSEVTETENTD